MPRPVERERHYIPALDGLRAVAVLCVLAYHLGLRWAGGGMLGVGVFFTLSGYLITDLLLSHWQRYGSLGLGTFWLRRARRLLPALYLVVGSVSVYVAILDPGQLGAVRRQAVAAVLYFANWSTIAAHGSYFGQFALPLPFDHLWSLAIEEQFYLVWPAAIGAGILLLRGRRRMAIVTLALAGVSAAAMAVLFAPGVDPTRVYEGTDTRAFGLLIGAALAMVWPTRAPRLRRRSALIAARSSPGRTRGRRRLLDLFGAGGLVAIGLLVWRTTALSPFLYPYGLLLLSLATAAVIAAVVTPGSVVGGALGAPALRWLGVRSYGIYLWQWPIIVLAGSGQGPVRWSTAVASVAGTLLAAGLSWRFLEQPIRAGALTRLWQSSGGQRSRARRRGAAAALLAAPAAVVAVAVSLAGLLPTAGSGAAVSGRAPAVSSPPAGPGASHAAPGHGLRVDRSPGVYVTAASQAPAPAGSQRRGRMLAVGAATMFASGPLLQRRLHARVDAAPGRSTTAVIARLAAYRRARLLPGSVVVQIGEDGPVPAAALARLRALLRGVPHVVLVSDRRLAVSWAGEVDAALRRVTAHWRQAIVAVPRPAATARAYVAAIAAAVQDLATRDALARSPIQATVVSDSVGATILDVPQAITALTHGLRLRLELMACRRLASASCTVAGVTPPPALQAIESLGHQLGPVLVVDVGYNDGNDGYAAGIDQVMRAALSQGVRTVIWLTLRQSGGYTPVYAATDAAIRRAATRWPELHVADWNRYSAGKPWFADAVHPNATGAVALAQFLHGAILAGGS